MKSKKSNNVSSKHQTKSLECRKVNLFIKDSWKIGKALQGELPVKSSVKLKANIACVLLMKK
jgi:hypothetical protein